MDLNMPGMNGIETSSIIRKLYQDQHVDINNTKIILFSCLTNTSDS